MKLPFASSLSFFSKLSYGKRIHAVRDWFVVLVIALVLALLSALWNTWTFFRVVEGEQIGVATTTPSVFSPATLEGAQQMFDRRALEEARYRSEYRFSDPAL